MGKALAKVVAFSEQDVHEHLMKQCPWYVKVCSGEDPGSPVNCENCLDVGEKLTALTPQTPEASTVDKPTVPPGGPGLFHHKGLHLPAYIQHLWYHLVKRYGKEGAYKVAVGVVKKWAAGINPGGWDTKSGKGKRTHPDVQAAAAKNIAEWEKDKAEGSGKVKATLVFSSSLAIIPEPAKSMSPAVKVTTTAHRLHTVSFNVAHAKAHLEQLKASKTRQEENFNALHIAGHLKIAQAHAQRLGKHFRDNYPAEGRELDKLVGTIGLAVAPDPHAKVSTTAHLLESVCHHVAHAQRHVEAFTKVAGQVSRDFNLEHVESHVDGAVEHAAKLSAHIMDNYPAEAKQLADVSRMEREGVSVALAAAAITAPGAKPLQSALRQTPSQTVAASPPLPPGVTPPTAAEVDAAAVNLAADTPGYDNPVLTGAVNQLRDAAQKIRKNEYVHALSSLRGAQSGILAVHREVRANSIPVANVFTVAVPPAEQSSVRAEMAQSVADREKFRKHYLAVSALIDRIRRYYFHGNFASMPEARFAAGDMDREVEFLILERGV